MTNREWNRIWKDAIDSSTYSVCKCGARKPRIDERVYRIGPLRVTAPVRVCPVCDAGEVL